MVLAAFLHYSEWMKRSAALCIQQTKRLSVCSPSSQSSHSTVPAFSWAVRGPLSWAFYLIVWDLNTLIGIRYCFMD